MLQCGKRFKNSLLFFFFFKQAEFTWSRLLFLFDFLELSLRVDFWVVVMAVPWLAKELFFFVGLELS